MGELKPRISVVIAVLNDRARIGNAIRTACQQKYENKEIVVIDGGSTDGTLEVIAESKKEIDILLSEKDDCVAQAYNRGVSVASGDWIYFLNADDEFYSEDTLSQLAAGCGTIRRENIVIGKVWSTDGRIFFSKFGWKLLMKNTVHHQGMLLRATMLLAHPYHEGFRFYAHDYAWNLGAWRRREKVFYSDINIAIWARGGISDNPKWRAYSEEFEARRQILGCWAPIFGGFTVARFLLKKIRIALNQ